MLSLALTNTTGLLQSQYSNLGFSRYGPSVAHAIATSGDADYVSGYVATWSSNPRSNKAREAKRLKVASKKDNG
jgi:hypothetical protein